MRCIVIRASNGTVELKAEQGTLRALVQCGDRVELLPARAPKPEPEPVRPPARKAAAKK